MTAKMSGIISLWVALGLMAFAAGCNSHTGGGGTPVTPPTTQQSLANARTALFWEQVVGTVIKDGLPSITNPTEQAVATAAYNQYETLLAGYSTDIANGNVAALQPDAANITLALESVGAAAGIDYVSILLQDITTSAPTAARPTLKK